MLTRVPGLNLQGASWSNGGLRSNDGSRSALATVRLSWQPIESTQVSGYECPVYLNGDRVTVLFTATLERKESVDTLTQRGVCLLANV